MGEPISDRHVVKVLRPFVRAAGPMVDALRESDPFGLTTQTAQTAQNSEGDTESTVRARLAEALKSVRVPGSVAWNAMDVDDRVDWWVNRVGRFTSLLTAAPGLLGALADRLPVQDTMGVASQGLLLCAIAGEHGVTEVAERVRLIGWVLFERDIDPRIAEGGYEGYDVAGENERTAELSEDLPEGGRRNSRLGVKAGARTLWKLGRSLFAITGELEKRPSGRLYHQALGALPVVGLVGNYFGERAGLRRVAKRARTWFAEHR
ncbi:hypothetical protein [Saccharomonospora cyanea]|uniref:Uncharacterized protein n=1 Tax=Saccharomonospora cyanea NA-134 TaxID=882082 RepID=H5XK00_9PSEU|nr:hypothetical protein [Saccharomonospora cyanea]EHR62955.1 hypothetical protein SaccyDRAFT_4134 [Saccharomonospora cyanea NA-134]